MSRRRSFRALPFVLVGATACTHLARPERVYLERVVPSGTEAATLDATMRQFARQGFSGSVLVARGTRVLLYKGYGDANRARHLPNTAETRYPFGALTTQFIRAAILELAAQGRLRLDQRASEWLGREAGDATIGGLLERPGATGVSLLRPARFGGTTPTIAAAAPISTDALLERLVAIAGGEPATEVIRRRFLQPAGLDRTVLDDGFLDDSLVARGYAGPLGETEVVTGLVGPLADLYRWHQALHLGTFLPLAARRLLLAPDGARYGLGWQVGWTPEGDRLIEHGSDQRGFQLWYGFLPDHDLLILVAANTDEGFCSPVAARLMASLTGAGVPMPRRIVTKDDRVGGS